ncbi:MAG: hypothetical protein AAF734_08840 [Bacteroidota bacterium]
MKVSQVAQYQIIDTFTITGRGLVLAGLILDGIVSVGDYIAFSAFGKTFKRKIIGVEGLTSSQPSEVNTGLLIKCLDEREVATLRNWTPQNTIAIIYQQSN